MRDIVDGVTDDKALLWFDALPASAGQRCITLGPATYYEIGRRDMLKLSVPGVPPTYITPSLARDIRDYLTGQLDAIAGESGKRGLS